MVISSVIWPMAERNSLIFSDSKTTKDIFRAGMTGDQDHEFNSFLVEADGGATVLTGIIRSYDIFHITDSLLAVISVTLQY